MPPRGSLVLDAGARLAIADQGRSLLAIGIAQVEGDFAKGDIVAQTDAWHTDSTGLREGDILIQVHPIRLTDDLTSNEYGVQLGLYDRKTFIRFPLVINGVERSDRILLKRISLSP